MNNPYVLPNSDSPVNIQPRPPEGSGLDNGNGSARRTHTTTQRFQCTCCSAKYTRQDDLVRHMKMHFTKGI